jgi:hypothetical protein
VEDGVLTRSAFRDLNSRAAHWHARIAAAPVTGGRDC